MARYRIQGKAPQVAESAYVAAEASLVGEVHLNERTSVWPGAAIRGDNEPIRIGARTNIQEMCMLHTDIGAPMTIGPDCTIGHKVILHGCTIGEGTLIGMGSTILNNARIGKNCLVGANSLVTEGKEFPDNSLIVGAPARAVRILDEAAIARLKQSAAHYVENAYRFKNGLTPVG